METIRASSEDAAALTTIAFAAKAHWGYPEDWLSRWADALTVTPDYIRANPTFAVVEAGTIAGFCAVRIEIPDAELDHLWVLPSFMRQGVGRALFCRAEEQARAAGARRLRIVGDPHAEGFYLRMGAELRGRKPANMDATPRHLPVFEKLL